MLPAGDLVIRSYYNYCLQKKKKKWKLVTAKHDRMKIFLSGCVLEINAKHNMSEDVPALRLSRREALEVLKIKSIDRSFSGLSSKRVLGEADGKERKDLDGVFPPRFPASPLALLSLSCACDNIFPRLRGGNRRAGAYRQECYSIGGNLRVSAQAAAVVGAPGRAALSRRPETSARPLAAIWSPTL